MLIEIPICSELHRRKSTTRQGRGRWRAPDLVKREFGADGLNRKWYGDGTEVPTDEGKCYLDSVLDMGSRRIVGFAVGAHHDAALATTALQMAVAVRGGKDAITGVILHTDQGFTAGDFRAACARLGITQSMGRVGSALDNSVIESWHSTVEFELRSLEHFTTRAQARVRVAAWFEEYDHDRRHSAIGMVSRSPTSANCGQLHTFGSRQHDRGLLRTERGPVLAGVKAKPFGWACGQP